MTTKKREYLTKTQQQNDETYIFEVIIKKQTFLKKKIEKGENRVIHVTGGGGQNHNGFKLDLASEYGISRSQLAWIIASNNDYMIIKERTTGYKEK